jgi:putative ABC transport system permease protein
VPWELALLVAAGWCWVLLEGRDAVVSQAGVAQVNGLLVAFPLLAVAGAAVLLARVLTAALRRLRRWAGRRRPPVFLAVNRLVAARAATATLLVAIALPVAVLGYTATLTASSRATLDAKVGVQLGAGAYASTATRVDPAAVTGPGGTTVLRFGNSSLTSADGAGTDVQTLAVDPVTFAGTAFWVDSFADRPLQDLVTDLTRETATVPVVAAGLPTGSYELRLGNVPVDVEVVATADVLPGRRTADPVVLVDRSRLPEVPPSAGSDQAVERWTDGDVAAAATALRDAGAVRVLDTVPADVQRTANFLGITWTFGYLSALAVFAGVIGAAGLLLYLEARSRSRVSGYVMARRLGLSRGAHLRSLLVELVGVAAAGVLVGGVLAVGAVAAVYRRLDVDLLRPPTPLLDVPWPAVALTVVSALAVAAGAALYAQRSADRADPSSVLREDA